MDDKSDTQGAKSCCEIGLGWNGLGEVSPNIIFGAVFLVGSGRRYPLAI